MGIKVKDLTNVKNSEGENSDNTDKIIFKKKMVETFPKDMHPQSHEVHPIQAEYILKNYLRKKEVKLKTLKAKRSIL